MHRICNHQYIWYVYLAVKSKTYVINVKVKTFHLDKPTSQ